MSAINHQLAPHQGHHPTPLFGVSLFRSDTAMMVGNILYKRSVCFVLQGSKRAMVGQDTFSYDTDHYLVTSVPLPVVAEITQASPQAPFLSLNIEITEERIRALTSRIPSSQQPSTPQRGLVVSRTTPALHQSLHKLLALLTNPEDLPVLGDLCLQEIIYHVLKGPQGAFLRAVALGEGKQHAISKVLMRIHEDCTQDLTMAELAAQAHMSQSVFFEAFKAVTASSPLQYIKRRRLMEAHRRLRLRLANVSEAAYGVGYNSTSQFSREFKRLYGCPPSETYATQQPQVASNNTGTAKERP